MDPGKLFGRGISMPPRIGAQRRVSWSVGEDNVRESIRTILLTEPGERLMLPEFGAGLGRFLFEPNTPATRRSIADRITRALSRWEPRITLESVDVEEDPDDPRVAVATLVYRLIATQTEERVSLDVNIGAG
jgi:phage baseplate assembly protein W